MRQTLIPADHPASKAAGELAKELVRSRGGLRSVSAGGAAVPAGKSKRVGGLVAAAELGERALLVAMRAKIAAVIDEGLVPPEKLSPLYRQLREVDSEIRALDARATSEQQRGEGVADETWDPSAL